MTKDGWKQIIILTRSDDDMLDVLAAFLEEFDAAKALLSAKGYGCIGMGMLEIAKREIPPASKKF